MSLGRPRLSHDFEDAVIEGQARRVLHFAERFADALVFENGRAVVAVRVVADLTEQDVRRPVAAGLALFGVVASLAEAAQVARLLVAREAQRGGALPDVLQLRVANVAADV